MRWGRTRCSCRRDASLLGDELPGIAAFGALDSAIPGKSPMRRAARYDAAGSNLTSTAFDTGVLLPIAAEASGTSTFASGK